MAWCNVPGAYGVRTERDREATEIRLKADDQEDESASTEERTG